MWYRNLKTSVVLRSMRLAQVKEQLNAILGGNADMIATVKQIIPQSKYQPAAAFFLAQGTDQDALAKCFHLIQELDAKKKVLDIQASKKGVQFNGQIYVDWLRFSEAVNGIASANDDFRPSSTGAETDIKPISASGGIKITRAKNPSEACQLGVGTEWCVSDPKQTMFASYRNSESATFYFAEDGNQPEDSPLRRVIINITKSGPFITDLNNKTGVIAEFGADANRYFAYLQQQGVDTSVLQNDPLTPEENALNSKLRIVKNSPDRYHEFANLPAGLKSEFISRAYPLTSEELSFLADNKLGGLMNQYLNVGHTMSENEFDIIAKNLAWDQTYRRKRAQCVEHAPNQMTQLDGKLLPELFKKVRPSFEKSLEEYRRRTQFGASASEALEFSDLPAYYKDDPIFALQEYKAGNVSFFELPEELQNNEGFALDELSKGNVRFFELPKALRNDKEVAMGQYIEGKVGFAWLPDELKNNREFATTEFSLGKVEFQHLPESLRNDPAFAMAAFNAGKVSYSLLPRVLYDDPNFVLKAYRESKVHYRELPNGLKNNQEFALEEYISGRVNYNDLPQALRSNPIFYEKAHNLPAGLLATPEKDEFANESEFSSSKVS